MGGWAPLQGDEGAGAFSAVHLVRTQQEHSHLQARTRTLSRTPPFRCPNLGIPASRTVRNRFLFLNHAVHSLLGELVINDSSCEGDFS